MKTRIGNVATLDLRKATPESVSQIDRIGNAALAIVSPETRALLPRLSIGNLVTTIEVPNDAGIASYNGTHTLEETRDGQSTFLLMNGKLTIGAEMTAEGLRRTLLGGIVNGIVYGSRQQMAALSAIGVTVNGKSVTYPDDTRLRTGATALTEAEASAMAQTPFLTQCVRVEPGAIAALAGKCLRINGIKGAIIDETERDAFYRLWDGEGEVIVLPEGYTLMGGTRTIGRREAPLLRGKRLVHGNLYLREDVAAGMLAALDSLIVTGTLFAPVALLDTALAKLAVEPELVPYEGVLLAFDGAQRLDADMSLLPERLAICCDGVLTLDTALDPAVLRERVTLLYVDGVAQMTQAQQMALLPVTLGNGQVETESMDEEPDEEAPGDDVHFIANVVQYVL